MHSSHIFLLQHCMWLLYIWLYCTTFIWLLWCIQHCRWCKLLVSGLRLHPWCQKISSCCIFVVKLQFFIFALHCSAISLQLVSIIAHDSTAEFVSWAGRGGSNTSWYIDVAIHIYVEIFCTQIKCEVKTGHFGVGHLQLKWVRHLQVQGAVAANWVTIFGNTLKIFVFRGVHFPITIC